MPTETELLERIAMRGGVHDRKPIICDMRMPVEDILGELARGETPETILEQHDFLEAEDIQACLLYAYHSVLEHRTVSKWYREVEAKRPRKPLTPEELEAKRRKLRENMARADRVRELAGDTEPEVDIEVMLEQIERGRGIIP